MAAKKRILTACVRLFIERGYNGTTVAEIIKEADVSASSFQNIFRSKDGVLSELAAFMFAGQFKAARTVADPGDSPAMLYAIETALQLTITELNDNLRDIYVEAYSHEATMEYIYQSTTAELYRIFGSYLPEYTESDFYELEIGSGSFVPGFEEQIVGHNPGETFDVTVTFPEDYGNEDLNGKEAVFETTLNYIKDTVTPELSDEWVAENLAATMSLNNVDELKAFVKSTMLYDNQASDVYTALHDKVSYADELPQTALDYYRDVLLYRIYTYAQNYGTDMATLLSSGMMGATYDSVDAYLDDATDSIKSITQQALLMQAVAEKMGFKCDTDTMNADFGRYYGTTDPSQYVSAYGENYIKMNVLQSDVMQNLIDNVKYE